MRYYYTVEYRWVWGPLSKGKDVVRMCIIKLEMCTDWCRSSRCWDRDLVVMCWGCVTLFTNVMVRRHLHGVEAITTYGKRALLHDDAFASTSSCLRLFARDYR
ncbi:hypothetical protein HPP92_007503 [Vanilla planifolia]|uniref:Uncharacterized protein n=1 Tax=Vanilla planifolia TaxID=51239 RepID=A0A835V7W4_VANPL|nr:hypothetical protein HPP92_007503 [Vanilla planifolia]